MFTFCVPYDRTKDYSLMAKSAFFSFDGKLLFVLSQNENRITCAMKRAKIKMERLGFTPREALKSIGGKIWYLVLTI